MHKQKEIIEEKNKEIIDSIKYAKRIQEALLKDEEHVTSHLPEHVVWFRPKDSVSGGFYWAFEKQDYWYVCVADCTGHGVPGAFMSMHSIANLNEINATIQVLSPAEISNKLRERIVTEFKQTGLAGENKDGLDISLIRLNLKTHEFLWAGANNPLWIIHTRSAELVEIKANKQPIGYTISPRPFTDHTLTLTGGGCLYLFSDGFPDQFGCEKGKKFVHKQLKSHLTLMSPVHMHTQKEMLTNIFDDWKGALEQVDDVCVIGIRLT